MQVAANPAAAFLNRHDSCYTVVPTSGNKALSNPYAGYLAREIGCGPPYGMGDVAVETEFRDLTAKVVFATVGAIRDLMRNCERFAKR